MRNSKAFSGCCNAVIYAVAYEKSLETCTEVMDTMPQSGGHRRSTGAMMSRTAEPSMEVRLDTRGSIGKLSAERNCFLHKEIKELKELDLFTLIRSTIPTMSAPLSIVFCGTSAFAAPALRALLTDPAFAVTLVITQPDRPVGRKQTLTPSPIKTLALEHGTRVWQPEDINRAFADLAGQLSPPAYLVVVSFGQILSQAILDFPLRMPVNVHASLLPRFRGASPIQNAILAGDKESGVTVQRMVKALDAGPILQQQRVAVGPRETFRALHDRLAELGARSLVETLKNPRQEQEQNEADIVFCRRLTRADGLADTNTQTAEEIDRRVRALNPWPGVSLTIEGEPLKLLETSLMDAPESFPLACRGGTLLHLVSVQPAGKKPMSGAAWGRGRGSR